jgi:hypothetical protein
MATPKKNAHINPKQTVATITSIPGGKATWYRENEVPIWKDREISVIQIQLDRQKLNRLVRAEVMDPETGDIIEADGTALQLSETEARLLFSLDEYTIWAYLKSWTLDFPLPTTVDEIMHLDRPLFDALSKHASKLFAERNVSIDAFGPDGAGDEESPTGA